MDACIAAARGWHRKLAIVLRMTGLHVSQAMGPLWSDLDLDRGILVFRGELGKSPSEKRGRVIPVSPHLVEELKTWGEREVWLVPSGRTRGLRGHYADPEAMPLLAAVALIPALGARASQ